MIRSPERSCSLQPATSSSVWVCEVWTNSPSLLRTCPKQASWMPNFASSRPRARTAPNLQMSEQGVRLQKVLAAAGVASRRAAELMISEGRVEVNGTLVTEQGSRVDPDRDVIRVDGSRIPPPRRQSYLVLNKPRGVVSTLEDPQGRPTLADFVPARRGRLFHVGRLDADTEGLLIMTNDGEFAHRQIGR